MTCSGKFSVKDDLAACVRRVRGRLGDRNIILIGLMGAGKSSVGRRLARLLERPFVDSDTEIEKAANMPISDIFATFGEPYFRAGERRVIARLLETPAQIIATGGGAYMDPDTRAAINRRGLSIWLKADAATLLARLNRQSHRPLLANEDPQAVITRLIAERHRVYKKAHMTLTTGNVSLDETVAQVVAALADYVEDPRSA